MISAPAKETVLVIEDDRDTGEAMELALSMEGYAVQVVADEEGALDAITTNNPAVILLDYYGVTDNIKAFISRIRRLHSNISIILMTGARNPEEKAKELGIRRFLAKPFNCDELRNALKRRRALPSRTTCKMVFSIF